MRDQDRHPLPWQPNNPAKNVAPKQITDRKDREMEEQLAENTDTELYREPGASPGMEYYQPSVHVTK